VQDARARFKSSEDLIHRLYVCISGAADQLQTNFAGDFRSENIQLGKARYGTRVSKYLAVVYGPGKYRRLFFNLDLGLNHVHHVNFEFSKESVMPGSGT
jgi:hypothetical protein